jgi:hypothetical protein
MAELSVNDFSIKVNHSLRIIDNSGPERDQELPPVYLEIDGRDYTEGEMYDRLLSEINALGKCPYRDVSIVEVSPVVPAVAQKVIQM